MSYVFYIVYYINHYVCVLQRAARSVATLTQRSPRHAALTPVRRARCAGTTTANVTTPTTVRSMSATEVMCNRLILPSAEENYLPPFTQRQM